MEGEKDLLFRPLHAHHDTHNKHKNCNDRNNNKYLKLDALLRFIMGILNKSEDVSHRMITASLRKQTLILSLGGIVFNHEIGDI